MILDEATRIQGNRRNYPFMRNEVEIALKGAFYEEKWSTGAYLLKKYFLVNISRTGHFTSIKGLPLGRRVAGGD